VSKKTVLLVEDHPGDRNMYGNILWYNGYDVILAEDGEAGLRLAHEQHPDLILLDLELPLMHGLELCSRLKQSDDTSEIPCIAVTGRTLRELGGNPKVLGYAKFLEKPVSPLQLLREVEGLIGVATTDQAERPEKPQVVRTHVEESAAAAATTGSAGKSGQELERIAAHLLANVDAVVTQWELLVREEPWFSLPSEHRRSNLTEVVEALTEASLIWKGDRAANRKAVLAGSQHGINRRAQGIPESLIPIEFHLLRQAIWRHLHEEFTPNEDTYSAIMTIDSTISLVLNAAMWGYYRDEIQAHDRWEAAIERLIDSGLAERKKRAPAEN